MSDIEYNPLKEAGETAETGALGELEPAKYDEVIEALKDVIDPEIGVNIVDLGLIYGLQKSIDDDALLINMTLTSAGCPLTDVLEEQTADALDGVVDAFRINWVWMPPWGPEKITEDGREQMRAIGFSI
jgi:metal-sulfur cluster biosynthetic enzyme